MATEAAAELSMRNCYRAWMEREKLANVVPSRALMFEAFETGWRAAMLQPEIQTLKSDLKAAKDKIERYEQHLIEASEDDPFSRMFGDDAAVLIGMTPRDIWQLGYGACIQAVQRRRMDDVRDTEAGR